MTSLKMPLALTLLVVAGRCLADGAPAVGGAMTGGAMTGDAALGCQLTLSRDEIDYGQLNRTTLKTVGGHLAFAPRSFELTLHCASAQPLRLDYRAAAASASAYRFGDQGQYTVSFSDARLDGAPVNLGRVQGSALLTTGTQLAMLPDQALVPLIAGQPGTGSRFSARVEVRSLAPPAALGVPQATPWFADGRFTAAHAERALTLRATLTPAACTPRLGQGGAVDFGRIGAGQLSNERTTRLQRSLAFTVQCDGPTRFALVARDNRAGSAHLTQGTSAGTLFGIGTTPSGQGIGGYQVRVTNPGADQPLHTLHAPAVGGEWQTSADADAFLRHDGQLTGFALDAQAGRGPSALPGMTAQLQIELQLAPLNLLRLDQELPIRGAATLEIVYL